MDGPPLFEFEAVSLEVGGLVRLDRVDATIPAGGVTAIVGPSGSGKSSLLRCCNRLELPTSGRLRFRGEELDGLDPIALRRRVGMVFQRPTPFPGTVADNLRVAAPSLSDEEAGGLLRRVQLDPSFLDRVATALSGGEAQRVCLARALTTGPEALLMDEPTAALDADPRVALERLAGSLAESGVTVVWVTHDLAQMRRVADHVLVMLDRRVAHQAPAATVTGGAPERVRRFLEGMNNAV